MAITIQGIKITSLTVDQDSEGNENIQARYQLISSTQKVLAKESLSSKENYGNQTFMPSPQTKKALSDAIALYRKDVEILIGLETT